MRAPALFALLLAACAPLQPPAPVASGPRFELPMRMIGTEPFWGVEVTPEALVYSGVDRPEQRAANPGPTITGTVATWESTTDKGAELKILLTATECSDGMSDRTYPLTARVEVAGETLNGCAAATAALRNASESGAGESGAVG